VEELVPVSAIDRTRAAIKPKQAAMERTTTYTRDTRVALAYRLRDYVMGILSD
jgi:hypothetical protein